MTAADLKYLLAIDELYNGSAGIKLIAIADRMNITKVSVHRAVERLEKNGYTQRDDKNKVVISDYGYEQLKEYTAIMNWICEHLQKKGGIPKDIAVQDAINAVCALSDVSRQVIAKNIIDLQENNL